VPFDHDQEAEGGEVAGKALSGAFFHSAAIIQVTRIKATSEFGAPAGLPWPAAARPPLRQGPRRATAKPAGSASAPGR